MKKKLSKIFLSLCMVLTLGLTLNYAHAAGSEQLITVDKDIDDIEITNLWAANDKVILDVRGENHEVKKTQDRYIYVPAGKTLEIRGNTPTTNSLNLNSQTSVGALEVVEGGTLEVNRVTLKSINNMISVKGTAKIEYSTLVGAKDFAIAQSRENGKTEIISSTIKSDSKWAVLSSDPTAEMNIFGGIVSGKTYKTTIEYSEQASGGIPVSNVKLGNYVQFKNTNTATTVSGSHKISLSDLCVDTTYLTSTTDKNVHETLPKADALAKTDVEAIALNYVSTYDDLMPAALEYSKGKTDPVEVSLLKDVTTDQTYTVAEGQNIVFNPANHTLESINTIATGGSAFYVQNGKLTVRGTGSVIGARTSIFIPEKYPDSEIVIDGDYTEDANQGLTIKGIKFHSIHANTGTLTIKRGNFDKSGGTNLNLESGVKTNITGGTYSGDVSKYLADGYKLRKNSGSPVTYTVVKANAAKDWWNPNGTIESGKLYTYNSPLATITNNNSNVFEVNGGIKASGVGNVLAKTINSEKDKTYKFEFDYTNRINAGTSKDENTLEVYAYPGEVTGGITKDILSKSTKIGDYYGNNNSWVHASGQFKATSSATTFFFKTKTSSGLGGMVNKETLKISEDTYALTDATTNNMINNGDFADTTDWNNLYKGFKATDVEVGDATTYTHALPATTSRVVEVNSSLTPSESHTLYQTFVTESEGRIKIALDFVKRTDGTDDVNRFAVYVVDATKVTKTSDLNKYQPVATLVGNLDNWQTTSFDYNVPKGQTSSMIVFKALTPAGSGIILDNVLVKNLEWSPEIEKLTDTSITAKAFDGATYELLDADGNVLKSQKTPTFDGLKPGTAYQVRVTVNGKPKVVNGVVTTKKEGPKAKDTVTPKVLSSDDDKLVIEAASGQEYSIDGGKTWVTSDTGSITFDGLKKGETYEVLTRKAETFDTMPGETVSLSVKLGSDEKPVVEAAVEPTIKERTANKVVLGVQTNQEYSIDGGKTWVTPTSETMEFDNLKENTEYTVLTRVKGNDVIPSEGMTFTTKIVVSGKVEGKDLPATVTITDKATGKVVAVVTTDDQGNWTVDLDPGQYDYRAEGKDKKQSFEGTFTVESGKDNVIKTQLADYKPAKTDDSTSMILPIMGLFVSIAGVWFIMRKRKANKEM